MSIEGQGHLFTIYFPGFVCFVLYLAKISSERLQDHWSSGILISGDFFLLLVKHFSSIKNIYSYCIYKPHTIGIASSNQDPDS